MYPSMVLTALSSEVRVAIVVVIIKEKGKGR